MGSVYLQLQELEIQLQELVHQWLRLNMKTVGSVSCVSTLSSGETCRYHKFAQHLPIRQVKRILEGRLFINQISGHNSENSKTLPQVHLASTGSSSLVFFAETIGFSCLLFGVGSVGQFTTKVPPNTKVQSAQDFLMKHELLPWILQHFLATWSGSPDFMTVDQTPSMISPSSPGASFWLIQGDFLMACGCVDAHVVLWRLAGKSRSLDITV